MRLRLHAGTGGRGRTLCVGAQVENCAQRVQQGELIIRPNVRQDPLKGVKRLHDSLGLEGARGVDGLGGDVPDKKEGRPLDVQAFMADHTHQRTQRPLGSGLTQLYAKVPRGEALYV